MKTKNILKLSALIIISLFIIVPGVHAKKLISEAKSVIEKVQNNSKNLSGELSEFFTEFAGPASSMVKLEAAVEELREKGYLGAVYADSPEKYERIYAEYARHMSDIKDIFSKYAPRIQNAAAGFNRSIYMGRDKVRELGSEDMSSVESNLKAIKNTFQELKNERFELDKKCSGEQQKSRNCQRERANYQRKLARLQSRVSRLKYMKKIIKIKNSVTEKLELILENYVDKEPYVVAMLKDYTFSFEQYSGFIGSKDLGGVMKTIRELGKLEEKVKDFKMFGQGLNKHVTEMGNLAASRLESLMKMSGIEDPDVQSRSDVLSSFDDQANKLENEIKQLEQDI